jgi:hypothetical protein
MTKRLCLRRLLSLVILLGLLFPALPAYSQTGSQQDTISPAPVTGFPPNSLFMPAVVNQAEGVAVIPETTEVMSSATTDHLQMLSADGTFTFDRLTPELAELDPGDVMVGGVSPAAPNGFLRKVTSVTQEDGALVVESEPAALEEAIQDGSVHMSRQLTPDMVLAASYADGVAMVSSPDGLKIEFSMKDVVLYDKDKKEETTSDRITASGSVAVELGAEFDVRIEWFTIKQVKFAFLVDEKVDLSAGWNVAYELEKSIPFANIQFTPITVWAGGIPIVLTPKVTLALEVDGSVGAAIEVSASQQATLKVGGEYRDGQWRPIQQMSNTFDFKLSPELEAKASLEIALNWRSELLLYGTIVAYINKRPYVEFTASLLPAVELELYGGINITPGIEVQLLGRTVITWSPSPWTFRLLLWSWPPDNSPPNIPADPSPPDGAVDQPRAATLTWTGGDPDDDPVTYDIYFEALDPNPNLLANDQAGTTFDVAGLAPDTTYYWRIAATDDDEATTAGPVWSFRTTADEQACDERHATVTFALAASPHSAQDMRVWGPYGNFLLDNPAEEDDDGITDMWTYTQVLPGTHNFAVAPPFRWWFDGATCEPADNCQVNMATRSVVVTVAACDDVTVTAAVRQKGSLTVNSFEDRNGDGERQEGEQGLSPWWSDLTAAEPDGSTSLVASNFDGGGGTWNVFDLLPGRLYTVCQKPQTGYTNVAPGASGRDERGWACYIFMLEPGAAVETWFAYTAGDGDAEGEQLAGAGRGVLSRTVLDTAFLYIPTVTRD